MSLSKTLYPLLSTGSNREDRKSTRYDLKFVDWCVKEEHKQKSFFDIAGELF